MSTVTTRDRRPLNPSSRLTTASNAAQPALSSHWESVAQAQRARAAAEAQNNTSVTLPSLSITPPVLTHVNLNDQPRSNAGSLPITPSTSSIPPSTAPPSESESNSDQPSTSAAKKGKNKQKRRRNSSGGVYQTDLLIYLCWFWIQVQTTLLRPTKMECIRTLTLWTLILIQLIPKWKRRTRMRKPTLITFLSLSSMSRGINVDGSGANLACKSFRLVNQLDLILSFIGTGMMAITNLSSSSWTNIPLFDGTWPRSIR